MGINSTPTKPFTFVAGGVIRSSEVNSDFDTVYNELNGQIGDANILAGGITASAKLKAGSITSSLLASGIISSAASGAFRNLKAKAVDGVGVDDTITITADEAILIDASNVTKAYYTISETLAPGTSGANGFDTGSVAVGWNHMWLIGKSDGTLDSLASASATAPTLPAGYTFKARIGAFRVTALATVNIKLFVQIHQVTHYSRGDAPGVTVLSGGTAGPGLASVDLSTAVPPTARSVWIRPTLNGTITAAIAMDASNANITLDNPSGATGHNPSPVRMLLDTASTVFYARSSGAGNLTLDVYGWEEWP